MSPLMLVAFLGSIKSGRAYVPVDVSMPVERIEQIKKQLILLCLFAQKSCLTTLLLLVVRC